jgi:tetratricopeptide (TPR) repeat protein
MTKRDIARGCLGVAAVFLAALVAWWSYHYAESRYHWREAQAALEAQDADRACVHLKHCLVRWNTVPEVRFLAAQAARLAGDYEEAEGHLAFCERQGGLPEAELGRERALLQVQQGDFGGYIESLMPRGPKDPELPTSVLEAMAYGSEATLFFEHAIECLARVLDQQPDNPRALLLLGDILTRKGFLDDAKEKLQAAVRVTPESLTPRLRLAECLLKRGEVGDAAMHLEVLCQRYPDVPEVWLARARLHEYRAQPEEAKSALRRILAINPNHVEALVAVGRLEFLHGDARDARRALQHAVEVHPGKQEAWEVLAWCHASLGNPDEEKRCLDEFARIRRILGEISRLTLVTMQDRSSAPNSRIEVAEGYERVHEPAQAIRWRFCYLQVNPRHTPTHRALARLFEQTGQPHRGARYRALAGG